MLLLQQLLSSVSLHLLSPNPSVERPRGVSDFHDTVNHSCVLSVCKVPSTIYKNRRQDRCLTRSQKITDRDHLLSILYSTCFTGFHVVPRFEMKHLQTPVHCTSIKKHAITSRILYVCLYVMTYTDLNSC